MTDRPILFSAPMVRALIEGRKTQTRRVLKPQPDMAKISQPCHPEPRGAGRWVWMARDDSPGYSFATADFVVRFAVGDRLWVRETWRTAPEHDGLKPADISVHAPMLFMAGTGVTFPSPLWGKARPAIHMPRWASRLTLTVTDVRAQRLQDISEDDARAEGAPRFDSSLGRGFRPGFQSVWEQINGAGSWDANPWVAALTFSVEQRNIDQEDGR